MNIKDQRAVPQFVLLEQLLLILYGITNHDALDYA